MGKISALSSTTATINTQNGLPNIIELLGDTASIQDFGQKIISDLAVVLSEIRKNSLDIIYIIDALRSDQKIPKTDSVSKDRRKLFYYIDVTDSVKSDLEFTRDVFQEIASTSSQNMELFATFGSINGRASLKRDRKKCINDSIRSSKEFYEEIVPFIKRHKEEINSNES
ncbi:hypothetical protein ACTFIR_005763 [Dictyostelium discoideum]